MEAINIINRVIAVLFFVCCAYQFIYIPIAFFKKNKPPIKEKLHRFAVLTAARNEEAVIGNLIESLKRQSYPMELIDIYVAADNCTDQTAYIAQLHGAEVFVRNDLNHIGKGFALEFLMQQIKDSYDAYLVFDADNVVDPDYITEMNKTFCEGYDIVTSYRNSKNYGDNWISSGYGLCFLRESQLLNRPRANIGTSCGVSGTGFMFSKRILKKCGGWKFFLLTEDVEFTVFNITNGEKIGYCQTAVFYDEQPTDFKQSVRQRTRWVQGYLQVLRRYGKKLLCGCFKGDFSCFDMLMNIAPAAILALISVIINLASVAISFIGGAEPAAVILSVGRYLLSLYMSIFIVGLITAIGEWNKIPCSGRKKLLSLFTFPFFMLSYLPITIIALFCKQDWKPILHSKNMSFEELAIAANKKKI